MPIFNPPSAGGGGSFPATTNLIAGTAVANTGADSGIDPGSVVTGTGTNGMLAEFTAFPGVIHDGISTNDVTAGLNLINAAAGVTGIIKGNGAGLFVPASPGTDFLAPDGDISGTSGINSETNGQLSTLSDQVNDLTTQVPLAGSFSGVGTATTTFTVTIGATMADGTYKVVATPSNILSAAVFYVTNKTTTTFDVVYLAGLTGTVQFDWVLVR